MDPLTALRDRLTTIADSAAGAMTSATGGASLCSVSRSGERIPGVKYAEGRWAAVAEVRRGLRGVDDVTAAVDLLASARRSWSEDLERRRDAGADDWVAYRLGGLDALAELAEHLDRSAVVPPPPPTASS